MVCEFVFVVQFVSFVTEDRKVSIQVDAISICAAIYAPLQAFYPSMFCIKLVEVALDKLL